MAPESVTAPRNDSSPSILPSTTRPRRFRCPENCARWIAPYIVTARRSLKTTPAMICSAGWPPTTPTIALSGAGSPAGQMEVELDPGLGKQPGHGGHREKWPERQLLLEDAALLALLPLGLLLLWPAHH